jgi:hypothetical protein
MLDPFCLLPQQIDEMTYAQMLLYGDDKEEGNKPASYEEVKEAWTGEQIRAKVRTDNLKMLKAKMTELGIPIPSGMDDKPNEELKALWESVIGGK